MQTIDDVLIQLVEFREEHRYTRREISQKTGISTGQMSRLFTGKKNMTLDTFVRIVSAMGGQIKIMEGENALL